MRASWRCGGCSSTFRARRSTLLVKTAADDMHLGLGAPNICFRARLRYGDGRASGGQVDVSGFTLPGLPGVVVGSNGHVAWGFTNSYGDWLDWERQPACTDPPGSAGNTAPCPAATRVGETITV